MKFIPIEELRDTYVFDSRSNYSVPPAIEAFLETDGYEACIRRAISLGGDSDTIAAITGGIAQAYYGIPDDIREHALKFLDDTQKEILTAFEERFMND